VSTQIRVLLADDQALFRSGLAVIVGAQPDMTVVGEAATGSDAVRMVEEHQPDIVLMDIRMPEMDGVEATRRIFTPQAAAGRTRPVRVVVLTTFNLDDSAAKAIRYGASGFLLKDTTPGHLQAAIRTVYADKEVEVLRLISRGMSNTEIAEQLYISESTVKTHVGSILRKLDLRDRVQIVVFAYQYGMHA
jgi:DNA-binding NarL/FixJ family response regulator